MKDNNIPDEDIGKNENLCINEELKSLLIEQVFSQKYTSKNYELSSKLFNEIIIKADGNFFIIAYLNIYIKIILGI